MQDNSARFRAIQIRASALTANASGRAAGDMLIELDAMQRELRSAESARTDVFVAAVFAVVAGFNALGRAQKMGPLLERAIDICRDLPDRRLLRRALSLHGYFTGDIINAPAALSSLQEAVELAREMEDPVAEVSTVVNLGVVLTNIGWDDNAQKAFQLAWDVYERWPQAFEGADASGAPAALMAAAAAANTAAISSQLNDVERGLEFSTRARALAQSQNANAQHRTVQLHYDNIHCILLAKAGRLKEAKAVAESMFATAKGSNNVRWEYLALQAAGIVEVRNGKVDEGLELLKKSHRRAASISTGMEVPAHLMLADAYRYVGKSEEALQVMRDVSVLLKKMQRLHFDRADPQASEPDDREWENTRPLGWEDNITIDSKLVALENLAAAAEAKQEPSGEHTIRTGALSRLVAARLPWAVELLTTIERAARLHDVGKGSVPETLLRQRGPLTWQEKEFLHSHAKFGEELIREQLGTERGAVYAHVARSHHERFDGNGTPDALSGQDIPLEARIVHAADAYDSLTHDRPWRKALPHDEVRIYLCTEKSAQFDPAVVDALLQVVKDLRATGRSLDDQLVEKAEPSEFVKARRALGKLFLN
ncbi:MAG TPA: HD domain-containing phosphohydrolase [Burkholderiaceae bacterium]|nr:HD domain-containing phosphohydrolase [Burkholderiaceae bacterium]